jgi:cytochrome c553
VHGLPSHRRHRQRHPPIVGWDADRFVKTLEFYRTGERSNPVRVSVVKSLDETQVRALAAYYASLPRPGSGQR